MMNEANGLDALFSRLTATLSTLPISYEIVCINDGSTDDTLDRLLALKSSMPNLVILDLSRNFGKEAALTAGILAARGNCVVPIDADLQDPPEIIGEMVSKWKAGAEVVLAIRATRATDTQTKKTTAGMFYSVMNLLSEVRVPANAGDFRLMDRRVVEALRMLPERTRFNKGIFAWLGFRTEHVFYDRPTRAAGTSKWGYWKLWRFAIDGITSFSSAPLRIWTYLGLLVATGAAIYAGIVIIRTLAGATDVPGYASLMVVILLLNGVVLIGLGVIGEYLSRVFIEVKGRPLYVVRQTYPGTDEGNSTDR